MLVLAPASKSTKNHFLRCVEGDVSCTWCTMRNYIQIQRAPWYPFYTEGKAKGQNTPSALPPRDPLCYRFPLGGDTTVRKAHHGLPRLRVEHGGDVHEHKVYIVTKSGKQNAGTNDFS